MNKTIEAFDKVRESATRLEEAANMLMAHIDSMTAQQTPSQPVKQGPVAWVDAKEEGYEFHGIRELPTGKHHLYAAPVDAKDIRAETKEECARKVEQFRTKMDAGIEHIAEAIRSL